MIHTKYLKSNGHIIGYREITDDPINHETATIGIYEGEILNTQYFESGVPTDRILVTGLSVTETKVIANNIDSVIINGLPNPCWLRVNTELVNVLSTSYSFSTTKIGENSLELIGKYYANAILIVKGLTEVEDSRDIDPKWAAIENATSAQIDTWIDSNVTNLTQARDLFKTLVKAIRVLHDRTK